MGPVGGGLEGIEEGWSWELEGGRAEEGVRAAVVAVAVADVEGAARLEKLNPGMKKGEKRGSVSRSRRKRRRVAASDVDEEKDATHLDF